MTFADRTPWTAMCIDLLDKWTKFIKKYPDKNPTKRSLYNMSNSEIDLNYRGINKIGVVNFFL